MCGQFIIGITLCYQQANGLVDKNYFVSKEWEKIVQHLASIGWIETYMGVDRACITHCSSLKAERV